MKNKSRMDIALLEPSEIISEGISAMLMRSGIHYSLHRISELNDLCNLCSEKTIRMAIINPSVLQNRISEFIKIKSAFTDIKWIGIVYSFFPNDQLNRFDDTFSITDPAGAILEKFSKAIDNSSNNTDHQENLSERETDVLLHLLKGMSNKEIGDTLNISIHTVISHRKNIMEKTGIKSLPGLTIYAISRKIIGIDKE